MSSITNLRNSLGGFPEDDVPVSTSPASKPIGNPPPPIGNSPVGTKRDRVDPRSGDILKEAHIPHPSGRQITIDYNPKTGGVFLDSGELKDLSEIKDIIPRLETILSRYQ